MRHHTKLRAFELADELAVSIYRVTAGFPREELYGLKQVNRLKRYRKILTLNRYQHGSYTFGIPSSRKGDDPGGNFIMSVGRCRNRSRLYGCTGAEKTL
jgi:hypothetical protein